VGEEEVLREEVRVERKKRRNNREVFILLLLYCFLRVDNLKWG
jgi:hypothetical protein